MKRHLALASAALVVLSVSTACGSDSPSTSDQVSSLCTDLAAVQSSIDEISGASFDPATTTVSGVQDTLTNVKTEVDTALGQASDVSASVKTTLSGAFDTYKAALKAIPSGGATTLAQAAEQASAAGTKFRTTWDSTLAELNCDTTTTTG
jgi:hypothetical protein